jgi:hypothetical protein
MLAAMMASASVLVSNSRVRLFHAEGILASYLTQTGVVLHPIKQVHSERFPALPALG